MSELRAACTAALADAETGAAADFATQLAALSLASARISGVALAEVTGDAARLGDAAALVPDLAAPAAELPHLGGAPVLYLVGAPDDPAGQLAIVDGAVRRLAALAPGNQARLLRGWGAELRAAPSAK